MKHSIAGPSIKTSHTSRCVRSGYTLLEMLIVCAILAAIAGLSWPTVQGSLAKGRLKKAASDVRTSLVRSRNDAIRNGESLAVQYELNGRRYRIQSQGSVSAETSEETFDSTEFTSTAVTTTDASASHEDDGDWIEQELPVGVRFASVDDGPLDSENDPFPTIEITVTTDDDSASAFEEGFDELDTADWSEPIVFHANGRTENAELRLMNDRDFFIDLHLRGLTGIVTSTPPAQMLLPEESDEFLSDEAGSYEMPSEESP
ncbi:MAG: prepilin-type N-terminal cleavage/methylation domain-containing protein [Planctomycetaceae bacterium]|nr:prepilin-type N-terminal cleavage/methylation domain-containing protein [Planctomycetaceae bacterium]